MDQIKNKTNDYKNDNMEQTHVCRTGLGSRNVGRAAIRNGIRNRIRSNDGHYGGGIC